MRNAYKIIVVQGEVKKKNSLGKIEAGGKRQLKFILNKFGIGVRTGLSWLTMWFNGVSYFKNGN
jgi:hypothetical protein